MEKGKKWPSSAKVAVIVMTVMILLLLPPAVIFFYLLSIMGTVDTPTKEPIGYCIHTVPEKLVYLAGADTELDLTGGEICSGYAAGNHPEQVDYCNPKYCDNPICMEEALAEFEWLSLETDADFTKPGRYKVSFVYPDNLANDGRTASCSFIIEVIDPARLQ